MTREDLLTLQVQYAEAAYQAAKHQQRAQLLLTKLQDAAIHEANEEIRPSELYTGASGAPDLICNSERAKVERGIVAEVARKAGLSHEHVRLVAAGRRRSPIVEQALRNEQLERLNKRGTDDPERAA